MLAQRVPGLLPALTEEEAIEVTAIHSIAGTLAPDTPLITRPPFIAPHHFLDGGRDGGRGHRDGAPGRGQPRTSEGAVPRRVRRSGHQRAGVLRTPLEEGEIRLARRDGVARYPARFQLILAANPCPCAPTDPKDCLCNAGARRRYQGKLSGPLVDRVDLKVEMHPIRAGAFTHEVGESTAAVRSRVAVARQSRPSGGARSGCGPMREVPDLLCASSSVPATPPWQCCARPSTAAGSTCAEPTAPCALPGR